MFGQFRGTRACFFAILKLWRAVFHSVVRLMCRGLFGTIMAIVAFVVLVPFAVVASACGFAIALCISLFELLFAILLRQ